MFSRFVLLRPEGGLNDILCRIFVCYQYCLKTERTLLIDTCRTGFAQSLEAFLIPKVPGIVLLGPTGRDFIDDLGPFFPRLGVKLDSYATCFDDSHGFVCANSGMPLTFDLNVDYPERCLIYHGCGGGPYGAEALGFFRLTEDLCSYLLTSMARLPKSYASAHLRYTDMRINLEEFFVKLEGSLSLPYLYVATDSRLALEKARQILEPNITVLNFSSSFISSSNDPIHMANPLVPQTLERSSINKAAFLDLLCLVESDLFFWSPTNRGQVSGYTLLARRLRLEASLRSSLPYLKGDPSERRESVML